MNQDHSLLRALRMNAAFSGISAILLAAAAGWLAGQLGLASPALVYVVAGLLAVFAIRLFAIARSRKILLPEIAAIIGGDFAWVLASVVLVALYYDSITPIGLVLIDGVALAVLTFAILQIRGLRIYRTAA